MQASFGGYVLQSETVIDGHSSTSQLAYSAPAPIPGSTSSYSMLSDQRGDAVPSIMVITLAGFISDLCPLLDEEIYLGLNMTVCTNFA